jgi:hypothetical protein
MTSKSFPPILKYPRTRHLEGSALQNGDEDDRVLFRELADADVTVVYEEKVDGANSAFSFSHDFDLMAQSRGHYLDAANRNAPRERDWSHMKDWLSYHSEQFLDRFEDRYIVYGEWMGITHSIFYNRLCDLFLEFDIYDRVESRFLDTPSRRALCDGLPIRSVPVLYRGPGQGAAHMRSLIGQSVFKSPEPGGSSWAGVSQGERWEDDLLRSCALVGDDFEKRLAKMDRGSLGEGLYGKLERDGEVLLRFKWVRPGFIQTILDADEHWQSRFPVPNLLLGPVVGLPSYLARQSQAVDEPGYDPDRPWLWAPWTPAKPKPDSIEGVISKAEASIHISLAAQRQKP